MSEVQADAGNGVDELTNDYFGSSQPEPQASEPVEVSQEPVAADSQTQPVAAESAQAPTPATPANATFRYQGKDWTLQELGANPDVARAIFTRAEQTAHYQQQLEVARQQAAMAQAQAQQAQAPPQQAQGGNWPIPDQLKAMYAPAIKNAVTQGFVEEEVAVAYPALTSSLFRAVDQLEDARQAVGILTDRLNRMEMGSTETTVRNEIDSTIANLSTNGGPFARLSDPGEREAFFSYLLQVNPQVGHLRDPQFMSRQYLGFKQDEMLANAREAEAARTARTAAEANKRRLAQGVGAGTRPGVMAQETQPWADNDLLSDFPALQTR